MVALIATLSGIAFLLGFAPPAGLRLLWRRPEQVRMQDAIGELMAATSEEEVAARVLPPMARMVGSARDCSRGDGRHEDRHVRLARRRPKETSRSGSFRSDG